MPRSTRCVLLCLGLGSILSGCNRSYLPAYSETEVLKVRQQTFEEMKKPTEGLGFIKWVGVQEGKNVYGPPGSNFAYPNFPASLEVERKGSDVTIERVASGATMGGEGVAPNTPAVSGSKVPVGDWIQTGSMRLSLSGNREKLVFFVTDAKSDALLHLHPLNWYPPQSKYWVRAKWVPLQHAHTMTLERTNKGKTLVEKAAGYAEFTMGGQTVRLYPMMITHYEGGTYLNFLFRDRTSETTTYPAGRYLEMNTSKDHVLPEGVTFDPVKPTEILLDFNRAGNPSCAYSTYMACPIPPPENRLPFEVPAGEKRYSE